MANTHDYTLANATGATFRADLNTVLQEIQALNAGSSAPSTTVAYKLWADTTSNTLKMRNAANNAWISLGDLTATNLGLATLASPSFTGTVTSAGDLNLTGTGSLKLPVGTTGQRPTPVTGDFRFNSTEGRVEVYTGSEWTLLGGGVPVGSIYWFGNTSAPTGYLQCNGAAVSRSTYSDLFTAISTTHGSGDGSSTFNVPDLRGEFIRGLDGGRGIDSGRSIGTLQLDTFKKHDHMFAGDDWIGNSGGYTKIGTHSVDEDSSGGGNCGDYRTKDDTTNVGGSETRPRNVALLPVIKF